jgi:hypothetical protein
MDDRRDNRSNLDGGRIEAPIEFASMSSMDGSGSTGRVRGKGGWEAQVKLMRKKNLEALGVGLDGDSEQSGASPSDATSRTRADTASPTGPIVPKSASSSSLPKTNTAAAAAKTQNMLMMMNLSDESHRRQRENMPAPLPAPSPAPSREPTLPNVSPLPQDETLTYPPAFQHRPTTSSTSNSVPADELGEISAQFPQPPETTTNRAAAQQAYLAQSNGGGLRGHPVQPQPLFSAQERLPLDFPQRQVPTAPQQKQPMNHQQRQHKYSFDARFDEELAPQAGKGAFTNATFISVQGGNSDYGDARRQQYQQQQQRGQPVRADSAQSSTSSTTTSSAFSNQSGTTSRTTMNSSAGNAGGNSNGYNHYHANSNATTNSKNNYVSHHSHTSSNRSFGNNNSNNFAPPPSLAEPMPLSPRTVTAQNNSSSYQADRFRAKVAAKTSAAALMIRSAHNPAPLPPPSFAAPSPPGGPNARAKVPLLAEQLARSGLPPVVTSVTNFTNVPSASNPGSSSISPLANSPLGATLEREQQQRQQQQQSSPDDLGPSGRSGSGSSAGGASGPTTTASMASAATAALAMDHRFSGGFQYGWDRERGFTGSAGTNSGEVKGMQHHGRKESRDAHGGGGENLQRRSVVMSDGFGVDLTDVPVFLRRVER